MPELPEVETVRHGLEKAILGKSIHSVKVMRRDLRVPVPANFEEILSGADISEIMRRGKYIIIECDRDAVAILHLGMSGYIRIEKPDHQKISEKHDHIVIKMNDGTLVTFNDTRRFGMFYLSPSHEWEVMPPFDRMGPEPLSTRWTVDDFLQRIKNRASPIKNVLLDQNVVAGIGNIYASEALFMAGISPFLPGNKLTKQQAEDLLKSVKVVLEKAIKAGGSTLKDYKHTDGEMGYFQHEFSVYGKEGEGCPGCDCHEEDTKIRKSVISGRSTFYCVRKQCYE